MPNKTEIHELLLKAGRPVEMDSRICFGIHFFDTEEKANFYGQAIRLRGDTYNGGYSHGASCGRDKSWDYVRKDGVKLYGVTVA
jgi:hypothetical protein